MTIRGPLPLCFGSMMPFLVYNLQPSSPLGLPGGTGRGRESRPLGGAHGRGHIGNKLKGRRG